MDRLKKYKADRSERKNDTLRLFRPKPHQVRVFTSRASELLVRGGNRSGKSVCLAALVSSAATGIPLTGPDGKEIPFAFPRDRPLSIWLIGFGEEHLRTTWHRLLLESQPELKRIKDQGVWRAYDPEIDRERIHDTRLMRPFIPRRMIQKIGWKNKALRFFKVIYMRPRPEFYDFNQPGAMGTTLTVYTSIGEVKKGDPVDLIAIDEDIAWEDYYPEWQARLSDRKGRIVWSVCPERPNKALSDLIRRAREEAGSPNPDVEEVRMFYRDNPFIDEDEKRKRFKGWSDQERRLRDEGDLLFSETLMYPSFSRLIHRSPAGAQELDDPIDKILRENALEPPDDWCRELVLDPGHTHPGVLFCAIPPSGKVGVVYDELYLPMSDANALAKAVEEKALGKTFHRFIIDYHAGRITSMGLSKTVMQLYAEAFQALNLRSISTGHFFQWSSDNVIADCAAVRDRFSLGSTGKPWLRIVVDRCPNLCHMLENYYKARDAHGYIQEKPAERQIDCLPDCLRYWIASCPTYVVPPQMKAKPSNAWLAWVELEQQKQKQAGSSVYLGAGAPPQQPWAV